eukprot:s6393_g1.t1
MSHPRGMTLPYPAPCFVFSWLEHAVARVCQEAGARVARNVRLADMNVDVPIADARRIEVDQKTSAQGVACPREISLVAEIRHRRRSKVACLQELTGTVAIPTRTAAMERLHCCRGPTSGEPCAAGPPPRFHQFLADGLCGVTSGVGSGAGSAAKKGQQKILAQRKVFPPLTTEVSRSSPLAFRYGEALLIAVGTRNTRLERLAGFEGTGRARRTEEGQSQKGEGNKLNQENRGNDGGRMQNKGNKRAIEIKGVQP